MKLNKILASACRRKILKVLSNKKIITMMKLVRIVNSTYNEVNRNLYILEREGITTQRFAGRQRIIRLNFKNEKTLVLLELVKIREDSADLKQFYRNLKRLLESNTTNGNYARH